MQDQNQLPTLAELDDWQLEDSSQDIRGWPLLSASGDKLGIIRRMLVDRDRERVAAVVLDNGQTVPVERIDIRGDTAVMIGADADRGGVAAATAGEEVIPIAEESLTVGKREVDRGHIRVRTRVVETPAEQQVTLREEHVEIERRNIDGPVRDADDVFRDRTIEVSETAEEAVGGKQARVTEEVVVSKEADQRVETIKGTVRHTEVDVGDVDGRR